MLSVVARGAAVRRAVAAPRAVRMLSAAAAAGEHVKVEYLSGEDTGVALFTLDRPEARNALGRQLINEFRAAMDQVRYDPKVRVVIVRSNVPKSACSRCVRPSVSPATACSHVALHHLQSFALARTSRRGSR
jgi:hypothetical protein